MIGPIIGWGRPLEPAGAVWCGVTSRNFAGSVLTACRGRWSVATELDEFVSGRESTRDAQGRAMRRCGACDAVAAEQRTLAGLAELKRAPVIETVPFSDFDLSDAGDETP